MKKALRTVHRVLILGMLSIGFCAQCSVPAFADFNSSAKGTATADFLKLGVGARGDAMGGAYSAVTDEATALYWNPAALTRIPAKAGSATLMHAPYVASSFYDYVGYAKNTNGSNAWGTGLQYFSAGSITQTDASGFNQGSFTPYDLSLAGGYAHQFEPFSLGFSAKYIRSQILNSAQTAALDVGILSVPLLNDRLRLAGVMTNLGGKMKFDQESDRLPLAFRLGSSYQITPQWKGSADVGMPIDDKPYLAVGTEYLWPLGHDRSLAARAGFNSQTVSDLNSLSGISMGIGMNFESISFDYALAPMGDLGLTHRLSLSFRFQPESVVLPKHESNLHPPEYPEYHDLQPYFDDTPSLRDKLE